MVDGGVRLTYFSSSSSGDSALSLPLVTRLLFPHASFRSEGPSFVSSDTFSLPKIESELAPLSPVVCRDETPAGRR